MRKGSGEVVTKRIPKATSAPPRAGTTGKHSTHENGDDLGMVH